MPRKRRGVPNSVLDQYAERLEQVRQSPELYGTTATSDEVVSFAFDQHANLLSLTGRGVGRARLWRAHQKASRKPVDEIPPYALQPTGVYDVLTEAFNGVEVEPYVDHQVAQKTLETVA